MTKIEKFVEALYLMATLSSPLVDSPQREKVRGLVDGLTIGEFNEIIDFILNNHRQDYAHLIMPYLVLFYPPKIEQYEKILKVVETRIQSGCVLGLAYTALPKIENYYEIYEKFGRSTHSSMSLNHSIPKELALRGFHDYVEIDEAVAQRFLANYFITDDETIDILRSHEFKHKKALGTRLINSDKEWKTETLWFMEKYFKEYEDIVGQIITMKNYHTPASAILRAFDN